MPELTAGTRRLHYEWHGEFLPERETLIFLHDGLGAVGSWRYLPARIGAHLGMNALVYDRWGYGLSESRADFPFQFMEAEVPMLLEILDTLGLERVHLVGHSDGGSVSLLLAGQHPQRVRTLVTVAAHAFVERETRQGIQALVDLQAAGRTPSWISKLHGEKGEGLLAAWSAGWLTDAHAAWNIEAPLAGIRCPLLVIQGEQDEFGTEAQVKAILAKVPGAESWLVPGCGHTPHNQEEEAFVTRVVDFLRGHQTGGG